MSMNMHDAIKEAIQEEAKDAEKYMRMAGAAMEKYPCMGYAGILRDIAHEELTHKKHLEAIWADMPIIEDADQEETEESAGDKETPVEVEESL